MSSEPTAEQANPVATLKPYSAMSFREFLHEVNWVSAIFLIVTPILAAILVPLHIYRNGWSWGLTAFLVILYTISNMSITVAYHRYFSHRSFDVPPFIQFLFLLIASMAFQGSAVRWSTDHRRHHREVDTDEDPYSINRGFFYAHLGWMLMRDRHPEANVYAKDLWKNRWIRIQHNYYVLIAIFMGFIVPGLLGLLFGFGFGTGMLVGGLLRIVLSQHSTFLINSAAHTFGSQPYTDRNSAKDSVTMAFLTFGEGYHNYHHFFQADYRNGIRWYQWDPTKWCIRTLAAIGLAHRLKKVSPEEILKARITMEEKRIVAKGASSERVQALRERIVNTQKRWKEIQTEFARHKAEFNEYRISKTAEVRRMSEQMHISLQEKRAELELARIEMNNAIKAWKIYVKTWLSTQPA
ncbi:MAG: fatty acid desaturase [Bdellovibrionaceae bacterium]|nr:fatty acid desaturase [Pseudobdellovibrionaceae bacterium]